MNEQKSMDGNSLSKKRGKQTSLLLFSSTRLLGPLSGPALHACALFIIPRHLPNEKKQLLRAQIMASNAAIEGVAGAAAGMVALVATYPLMTVRLRFSLPSST